jgi:tRNA pseudouridine65 synthase
MFGSVVMHISIIFRDEHLIVVHKPPGLLVHRSPIDKHETRFLLQILRDQIGQYVYPIHRLDKPTSGLIMFALDSETAKRMSLALEAQTIEKTYIALVRGYVQAEQVIDRPLVEQLDKMTDNLQKENEAKPAMTELMPLARFEMPFAVARYQTGRFSLLKLKPKTGRKHQLRRHMAHIRHPIIGDTTHGDGKQNRYAQQHMHIDRLALCAHELKFQHPYSEQAITLKTTLDNSLRQIESLLTQYCTFNRNERELLGLF